MAFPGDRMPVRVRCAFGADADASPSTWSWTDITKDVHAQQVAITRGQPNESSEPSPTSISLVLDNPHGDYTPDNPLGVHYPNIDQGVPLEFSLGAGAPYLSVDGAGQATTPDAPALDITGDLDVRMDATLEEWRGQANLMELAGRYVTTGDQRSWGLFLWTGGQITFRWTTDGTLATVQQHLSTAAVQPASSGRLAIRVTVDVDNGAGGFTVRFYTAPTLAGPWTQLGDPVTAAGVTSLFAGTAPLEVGDVPGLGFEAPAGQVHGFELRNGIDGTLVASPDFTALTPGTTAFTDGAGRSWTLAQGAAIQTWQQRFLGHVDSWLPVWPYGDLSHRDAQGDIDYEGESQVTVTASGILRRMGQGEEPLQSTLRRRVPSFSPLAYWPMEDGTGAAQAYSPVAGVRPLNIKGFDMAADDSLAGSSALPTVKGGATLSGSVPAPAGSPTQWHTEFVFFCKAGPATARTVLQWLGTGTVKRWQLLLDAGGAQIFGYDADDATVTSQFVTLGGFGVFGAWTRWKLFASQSGGTVNYSIVWVPIGGVGGLVGGSYAGTVGRISGLRGPDSYSADLDGLSIGHIGVFTQADTLAYNNADTGFNGERAGARLLRLCQEEGVPFTLSGDAADTEQMGPQRPDTLTALLAACAAVDGGLLGEQRAAFGLKYRTRASMYNQPPALVLDASRNEITNPFAPVLDDQQLRNAVTLSREGGSSATAVDTASIARRRRYGTSDTVNAFSDDRLPALAGWRLHLGTWPGMRYPSVSAELAIAPQLIEAWLGLDYGDRLQAIHLPPQHPSDTVDLLMQGYTETISPTRWSVQANCNPAGPWTVGVVGVADDATPVAKADANGSSRLTTAVDTDDTALTVTTGSGPVWITAHPALNANPDFETDLTDWFGNGAAIDRVAAATPKPFAGAWALRLVPNGVAQFPNAGSLAVPVTAGQQYVLSGWLRCATSRTVNLNLNWFQAGGAYLSTSANGKAVVANTWTWFELTATAPASALTANAAPTVPNFPPATDVLWAHQVTLRPVGGPVSSPFDFPISVRAGGEVMTATAISDAVRDEFARSVTGGWGQATSGQNWTTVGAAADYSVGNGYGAVNQPAVGIAHLTLVPAPSADVDLVVDVATSVLATGSSLFGGPIVRAVDNNTWYGARLDFTTSGALALTLRKRVAATETQLASATPALTHTAGTFYRIRVQAFGSELKAKVWLTTDPEPKAWHVEATDSALTAAASVGTRCFSNTGNTNTNPQIRFDNFRIVNPQTFTVRRSRNAVVKAHAAGTDVRLAYPTVVAL